MKKIALALALAASVLSLNAQVKSVSQAKAAVDKAKEVSLNPKKAGNVNTWLKLGQSYLDAYNAPQGEAWVGASKQDLALVGVKPGTPEEVTIGGETYIKEVYPTCNYYFKNDVLNIIEVTSPVVDNPLGGAFEAFKEAYKLDTKKAKTADIAKAFETISQKYVDQGYNAYTFGDYAKASEYFENAANVSVTAPSPAADTNSFYNAALTAWMAKDYDKADRIFNFCLDEFKYSGNDGDVYAKLADIYEKTEQKDKVKAILERGFSEYPQSQAVLIGLINYYIVNNEDTSRLFQLLESAKQNEPNNASLWYVEGNVFKELGKVDEAVAAYRKCSEISPDYEYGYIGEGILWYNNAIDLQEKAANEMDDAKYEVLAKQFEESLKNCIKPFQTAFDLTKDNSLKVSIAEYLKNACYRFASEDESYKAAYDKYAKIVAEGRVD